MKRLLLLAALLPLLVAAPARAEDYPAPDGFVVDTAGVLPASTEAALERELSAYDQRTTNQVAVLVIRSLEGQELEGYATQVFNTWGIGQRGVDNGVLLLLAIDDRQDRIEVGRGLESVLTPHRAQLVLDNVMRPALRQEDYAAAVTNGERAVRALLGDRSVAGAPARTGDVFAGGASEEDTPADGLLTNTGPDATDQPVGSSPRDVGWFIAPAAVVITVIAALGVYFRGGSGFFSPGGARGRSYWYGGRGGPGGGTGGGLGGGLGGGGDPGGGGAGGGGSFGGGSSGGGGASGSW